MVNSRYLSPQAAARRFYSVGRIFSAALAAAVAFTAQSGRAESFRAQCEARLAHSVVTVTPRTAPYTTNMSLDIAELTVKSPPPVHGQKTLGLTVARHASDFESERNGLRDPDTGEYCMRPSFQVTLSYNPIEVFVARELAPGSCPYQEVLHHELRHVEAYRQQLSTAVENVGRALRAHYADRIFYGDPESLRSELEKAIEQHWLPFAQHELEAVEKLHQGIDTAKEYRRYQTVCDGEINRILAADR
jgi:hypothetical protein